MPSLPSCCCQAIFAKRVPSGHGEMAPDSAAWMAMSLPRMKRKLLLSPRSVKLTGFQSPNDESKATPLHSGRSLSRRRDVSADGAGSCEPPVAAEAACKGDHGARYAFSA